MIWKLQYGKREWFCGCGMTVAGALRKLGISTPVRIAHSGPGFPEEPFPGSDPEILSCQPRHQDLVRVFTEEQKIQTTNHHA